MLNRSKIGKSSKEKGYRYEKESAEFWSTNLSSKIVRTPRSGGLLKEFKGDLVDLGNSILKGWLIEIKGGKTAVPKKIEKWAGKLSNQAQGTLNFLEISKPYQEPLIIIKRKYFARILKELQDWEEK